ncbi:MAG: nitrate reductase molybdenum cofactor assembly chaperone [Acidobacteriota bacterium]
MADLYQAFAALLTYPDENYRQHVQSAQSLAPAECGALLAQFAESIEGLQIWELEELFTRTFDMNPMCSLELGWHLFGENYERGLLLVRLREELRQYEIPESTELPDHLTHILTLLGRMDHARAEDFTAACVLPAVTKMIGAVEGKGNPYQHVLLGIQRFLRTQFPEIPLTAETPEPLLKVLV